MGVIRDSLRSLLPRGRAFWLGNDGEKVLQGVSESIEEVRTGGQTVSRESWPGTAVDTLPQWHATMGVQYDPLARTIAEQQTMLSAMETAIGGNTLALLQAQFDKEFDGRIVVSEAYLYGVTGRAVCGIGRCGVSTEIVYALGYNITGTVNSATEAARIVAIIARYGPAHLTPNSLLTDPAAVVVGLVGLGRVGLARTGRAS